MVPGWVADLEDSSRTQFQHRAKLTLRKAVRKLQQIKGKSQSHAGPDELTCVMDGCDSLCGSPEAYLDHIRRVHGTEDRDVAQIRWLLQQERIDERVRARQERGVMATGFRWPGSPANFPGQADQVDAQNSDSNHGRKRRKGLNDHPV